MHTIPKILFTIFLVQFAFTFSAYSQSLSRLDSLKKVLSLPQSDSLRIIDLYTEEGGGYFIEVYNRNSPLYSKLEISEYFKKQHISPLRSNLPNKTTDSLFTLINTRFSHLTGNWIELYLIDSIDYVGKHSGYTTNKFLFDGDVFFFPYAEESDNIYSVKSVNHHNETYYKFSLENRLKKPGYLEFIKQKNKPYYLVKLTLSGFYHDEDMIYFRGINTTEMRNYPLMIDDANGNIKDSGGIIGIIQSVEVEKIWSELIAELSLTD